MRTELRLRCFSVSPLRESYGLWIDGQEVQSSTGEQLEIENPLDGRNLTQVACGSEADIQKAVAVATDAFNDGRWSKMQPSIYIYQL